MHSEMFILENHESIIYKNCYRTLLHSFKNKQIVIHARNAIILHIMFNIIFFEICKSHKILLNERYLDSYIYFVYDVSPYETVGKLTECHQAG